MSDSGMGFLALFAGVGLIGLVIGIALYVVFAIGLYTMAQRKGIENAFLAWIPIAQLYIWGKIIKTIKVFSFEIPSAEIVLPVAALASAVLGAIPLIGFLIGVAVIVINFGALYSLYKTYNPSNAVMFTVLSILGFTVPFFVFILRNNEPLN